MDAIRIDASAFYTVHAIARELGVSKVAIHREIRDGKLAAVKRGRQRFVAGQSVIDWLGPEAARRTQSTVDKECVQ